MRPKLLTSFITNSLANYMRRSVSTSTSRPLAHWKRHRGSSFANSFSTAPGHSGIENKYPCPNPQPKALSTVYLILGLHSFSYGLLTQLFGERKDCLNDSRTLIVSPILQMNELSIFRMSKGKLCR